MMHQTDARTDDSSGVRAGRRRLIDAGWGASVLGGLATAARQWRLVLLVWFAFVCLAAFAALPTWRACSTALSGSPEGDRLLGGLNIALLREMSISDGPVSPVMLPAMALGALLVALAWNPFVSGGLLTVLLVRTGTARGSPVPAFDAGANATAGAGATVDDSLVSAAPTVRERFFAGGARHYWRLARLLLVMLPLGVLLVTLAGMALFGATSVVEEQGLERAALLLNVLSLALLAALAGLVSLLTDYARVVIVRDGLRVWRAVRVSLHLLFRHGLTLIAFGLTFALLFALGIVLYFTLGSSLTIASWTTILLAILLQQLFSLARTGLRVAMIAGELQMLAPLPSPKPSAQPTQAEPMQTPYDDADDELPIGLS